MALNAVLGAALALFSSPAQAAPVYWTFQNLASFNCLTGGTSGAAWLTTCTGSTNQQWDWIGTSNNMLKNRATGRCLTTDNKTASNATWTSTCVNNAYGQVFHYTGGTLYSAAYYTYLRAEIGDDGVRADRTGDLTSPLFEWIGTHN
ncbi:ricin-type beta-trefoil lectin domain protein [Spirillospora sp. NPDC029432]|uniref:RICIN domain-containing protein n=1 Tax=Spirillospora sp. NPDC029432 TaxID=3154599 RepID=UPI0034522561